MGDMKSIFSVLNNILVNINKYRTQIEISIESKFIPIEQKYLIDCFKV